MVIGHERPQDGLAGGVVVPDGGGQGKDALEHSDSNASWGVAAVLFQVKLAFEGVVDRFDDLAQRLEQVRTGPRGLALAGRPQQPDPRVGHGGFEVVAVVVLVTDESLAGPGGDQVRASGEHAAQHIAFVSFGAGQGEGDGQALQGADQVQPQAPEVPRMTGAIPVFGPSGQVRALGGLAGPAALDWGGIDYPHIVAPDGGIGGQKTDAVPDQRSGTAQPLVIAGLLGQVREQVPQVSVGVPQPAGLGGEPQQGLHDGKGDQLSITQLRVNPHVRAARRELRRFLQQVICLHVQCSREGIQVGRHKLILGALASSSQPPLGIDHLGRQLRSCRAWLPAGWQIVACYWDVESGGIDLEQRSQGRAWEPAAAAGIPRDGGITDLLAEARSPMPSFAVVVCEDIERSARDTFNSLKLERELNDQGIPLFATDEPAHIDGINPTTVLVRRVKQGVAEWYRLQLKEKVWNGLKEHSLAGWNLGTVPYGYTAERHPHPNPAKNADGRTKTRLASDPVRGPIVTRIFQWRVSDGLGLPTIAARLNADPGVHGH